MPIINVKLTHGELSPARKKKIVQQLTDTMVSIEGEAIRSTIWVIVEEVRSGDWAISSQTLPTGYVHAKADRRAA